jgi:solute carrier family 8 (sodium/calcium exchanger)
VVLTLKKCFITDLIHVVINYCTTTIIFAMLNLKYISLINSVMNEVSDDESVGRENDIFEMMTEEDAEHETDGVNLQQQSHSTTECTHTFGQQCRFTRGDEVYSMKKEYKMVKEKKFVCSLDLLLQIFQSRCQTPGCTAESQIQYHFIGVTVVINSVCSEGHKYRFCSSPQVNDIYANNLQAATSLMFSGNQFSKIERMAKFFNLEFLSSSTYYRFQRLYLIPEINEWWSGMRKEILVEFADKEIVVGGDGQCDSPGFNAKNLCYFIMEESTNHILDVEVLDKRHVGLVSTNMEKEAVQRCLDRLTKEVRVGELVTDASTTVKALLGKLIL